jgi:hypothetical protein
MDLKKILAGTSVVVFLMIALTSDSQHFTSVQYFPYSIPASSCLCKFVT